MDALIARIGKVGPALEPGDRAPRSGEAADGIRTPKFGYERNAHGKRA
jgi:hypothetical protein